MDQIVPVDVTRFVLDLRRDLSVTPRATKPGPVTLHESSIGMCKSFLK